jgi:hypothetical protein
MLLSIEDQFSGIQQTLEEVVVPCISSPYVRGQVFAVMEILNQMQNWVEYRSDLLEDEISRTREVISPIAEALKTQGLEVREAAGDFFREKENLEVAFPKNGKELLELRNRTNRLLELSQQLFHDIREVIPPEERAKIEKLLGTHIGYISKRNLKLLRPTLLKKISTGGEEKK